MLIIVPIRSPKIDGRLLNVLLAHVFGLDVTFSIRLRRTNVNFSKTTVYRRDVVYGPRPLDGLGLKGVVPGRVKGRRARPC